MRKQWRCFHCDAIFTRRKDAAEHFGADQADTPACCLRDHEHHLVHYIRRLEQEVAAYRADDSDVMRSIMVLESEHAAALKNAEEDGYSKGVQDMKSQGYCADPQVHSGVSFMRG